MKYCYECGTKLVMKELEGEGEVSYCESCKAFRFPIYNTAVSMEVLSPNRDKILLIKQYGRDKYILVAGYVNRGEQAEEAVVREAFEELGIEVEDVRFNKSEFFEPSNTLMLNFSCVAKTEELHIAENEVDSAKWFTIEEVEREIFQGSLAHRFLSAFLKKNR
ncbi:MAG: NUDIX domain-containing protein [Oscillospiraceae bacterium]|nr:NUDIX domain-containing protein [Oscillospiraceae bacterium]